MIKELSLLSFVIFGYDLMFIVPNSSFIIKLVNWIEVP